MRKAIPVLPVLRPAVIACGDRGRQQGTESRKQTQMPRRKAGLRAFISCVGVHGASTIYPFGYMLCGWSGAELTGGPSGERNEEG